MQLLKKEAKVLSGARQVLCDSTQAIASLSGNTIFLIFALKFSWLLKNCSTHKYNEMQKKNLTNFI